MSDKGPGTLACDLDATLAKKQEPFNPYTVGEPVQPILDYVKDELAKGRKVVCFTARAASKDPKMHKAVRDWLDKHGLGELEITNEKQPSMSEFLDDKAVGIVPNKGTVNDEHPVLEKAASDSLELQEKIAASYVRRTKLVEQHSDHCPHCDHEFSEKGYPRPDPDDEDPMTADSICPHCHGRIEQQELSDQEIDSTVEWLRPGMRKHRESLRARRERQSKQAAVNLVCWNSPETDPFDGELKKEAKSYPDKLKRLWLRQGKCPECGGVPVGGESDGEPVCSKCDHTWTWAQAKEAAAKLTFEEKPAKRFMCPENWDPFDRRGGVVLLCGANDWECANTWLWAEADGHRVWIQLKFPKNHPSYEKYTDEDEKAWKDHAQAAKDTWRNEAGDDDATIEDFEKALKRPAMKPFILASGVDKLKVEEKQASAAPRTGPLAIAAALKNLNLDELEKQARADIATGKVTKREKGVRMLQAISGLRRNEMQPHELMITKVPVLPPAFRPFSLMGSTYIPGNANELYADLFKHRDIHKQTVKELGEAGGSLTRRNLLNAVRALYGYGDPVSPKLVERRTKGFLQELTGGSPKTCYDDDTEILTRKYGWVKFASLPEDTEVASVNPASLAFEWQKPTAYTHARYIGQMVRLRTSGGYSSRLDLLVTPNHRMWQRYRIGKFTSLSEDTLRTGWSEEQAWTYLGASRRLHVMTASPCWESGHVFMPACAETWDPKVFARFLGWWLAEGDLHTSGTIATIWQSDSNKAYCVELEQLQKDLREQGCVTSKYRTRRNKPGPGWGYAVRSARPLCDWLRANCGTGCATKRIPRIVMDWPRELLVELLRVYLQGDGAKVVRGPSASTGLHRLRSQLFDGHHSFCTTSPGLFDDVQEACFKLGFTVRRHQPQDRPDDGYNYSEIYEGGVVGRWTSRIEINWQARELQHYDGHVHCCTVPNGLLVVRRNGAMVVSGNSFFQKKMISKPLDSIGRGVITVDPDLGMNQISLPKDMAWTLYGSFVQRRLAQQGFSPFDAVKAVKDRTRDAELALQAEMQEGSGRPVIYSRAPSWHKFNTIGGWARMHDGDNIAINPYTAAGLGADFDGDTLNVNVPIMDDSVQEAKEKLMPDKMLFSIRNQDQSTALPKQEMILGLFANSIAPSKQLHRFGSKQEALAAAKRGDVGLSDEIEYPDD